MTCPVAPTPRSGLLAWLLRALLLGVGAAVLGVCATAPAAAHNSLQSTSPDDGQTVARTPSAVVLTFDEPALAMGTKIVVTGPGGEVQQGPVRNIDNTVRQDLQGEAPAGSYTVAWRVTSADGHPISGSFAFTSRQAGVAQPAPTASASATHQHSPAPPTSNRVPPWVGLVLLVAVAGTVAALVRRRRMSLYQD
jgi:methionine-rich copper-binding protein CopC